MKNLKQILAAFVLTGSAIFALQPNDEEQRANIESINRLNYKNAIADSSKLGGFKKALQIYNVPAGFDANSVHLPQVKESKIMTIDGTGY